MRRQAAVAGAFYPSDAGSVKKFIEENQLDVQPEDAALVLVPHAGYIYSGGTAVRTLSNVNIPDTVILIGPNHTGAGPAISVYPDGSWGTPFGDVDVDGELVEKLCADPMFTKDTSAHESEHSLEVILPLLKHYNQNVKVVCITVKYISYEDVKKASEHLSNVTDGLVVISSDFNHFENADVTERKDKLAIDRLMHMDAEGLYKIISEQRISMCGVIPACIGILYSIQREVSEAVFVEHTHSGFVNGDNNRVVGYAGLYYK